MVNSFLAESVGSDGYAIKGPAAAALQAGAALIALAGDQIGFTSRPVMQMPAATPTPGQVLAWNGSSWEPSSISAGTPGGTSGQLQYNNGGVFGGLSGSAVIGSDLTLGGNLLVNGALQLSSATTGLFDLLGNLVVLSPNGMVVMDGSYAPRPITASQFSTSNTPTSNTPAVYVNQTWNNVAIPFTLMYGNVTDSASASTSNLIDLQVGATSRFKVDKNATISAGSTTVAGSLSFPGSAYTPTISRSSNGDALTISRPLVVSGGDSSIFGGIYMRTNGSPLQFSSGSALEWSNATDAPLGTVDAKILRNTTGQLDVRADSGLRIRNFANGADAALQAGAGTFSGLTVGTTSISAIVMGNASVAQFVGALYLGSASGQMVHLAPSGTARLSIDSTSCTVGVPLTVQNALYVSAHNTFDIGQTGTRFKDGWFQGTVTGSVLAAGGTVTASTPALNVSQTWNNVAVNFTGIKGNFTATAHAGNSLLLDLQLAGVSKFSVGYDGNITTPVDKQFGTSDGQQRLYFANGAHTYYGAGSTGNHVFRRNNGAEYAPIIAQTLALGGQTSNPATGCLLAIDDMQGSSYPSIKIVKGTWGSPISMNWATESAGIASTGTGALFSHVQTITQTSLANSPVNGGGLDVRCEYDQPYVAGIYVRGRKTRTDAPTHPNLAYGIYAVANSGKASGLGGAAGYFLCETPNVAGVQVRAAASQTQPTLLIQDSSANTLFQVDNTGNTTLYGYSGLTIAYGSCYIHQDGNFQIGTHAKLKRATNDLKVCAPNTYFRNFADSADSNIYAGAAVFSSTVTSAFQTLSADPTTTDISAGNQRMVKNSTSGTLKLWANDAGTMKSVALT